MPDPLVVVRLREFKTQLLAREADQMADMTRRWLEIERALEARISELAQDVADLKAAGVVVGQSKLYELERYQSLLAEAHVQVTQYERWAGQLITDRQREWGRLGLDQAHEAIQLSFFQYGEVAPHFDRPPVEAIENMIGFAGDGTPLHDLLKEAFPQAWDGLETALTRGVALGLNPRATAADMRDGFGLGLDKALTIARSEQIRAYRMAGTASYRASGLVDYFTRLSAHQTRTCLACLAAEGERFDVGEELGDHPSGRCTMAPHVIGFPEQQYTRGEEWFNTLDPEQQQSMMGPGRYDAWQEGRFRFSDLVTTKHDAVWGDSPALTPLSRLAA